MEAAPSAADALDFRRVVRRVAWLNLGYFGVECAAAAFAGSVSLFADSIDFLEDASINFLILMALGWTARRRARVGFALAAILLAPGFATAVMAWRKYSAGAPPQALPMSIAALGALAVNTTCALMLTRHRIHHGSLARAAFLSAWNDVMANLAIIGAGVVTVIHPSAYPDLVVGLGILVINLQAAREVYSAARDEHRRAEP